MQSFTQGEAPQVQKQSFAITRGQRSHSRAEHRFPWSQTGEAASQQDCRSVGGKQRLTGLQQEGLVLTGERP